MILNWGQAYNKIIWIHAVIFQAEVLTAITMTPTKVPFSQYLYNDSPGNRFMLTPCVDSPIPMYLKQR